VGKTSTSPPSPLSPTNWPAKSFHWSLSLALLAAVAAAFLLATIGVATGFRMLHLSFGTKASPTEWTFVATVLIELPLIALLLVALPRVARRTLGELGLHPIRFRDLYYAFIGAVTALAAAALVSLIETSVFHLNVHENVIGFFSKNEPRGWLIGIALVAVIYGPVVEELLFRGFIFNAILRYVPVGAALAISGIIFAGAHFEDPTSFVPLAVTGIILATIYYRTGSLVTSMLAHGTFNFISLALYLANLANKHP